MSQHEVLTPHELEQTMLYNFEKMKAARAKDGQEELERLFESRFNRALEALGQYFHTQANLELGSEDGAVLES